MDQEIHYIDPLLGSDQWLELKREPMFAFRQFGFHLELPRFFLRPAVLRFVQLLTIERERDAAAAWIEIKFAVQLKVGFNLIRPARLGFILAAHGGPAFIAHSLAGGLAITASKFFAGNPL